MEEQYVHSVDGQEVGEEDINLIAAVAALADDKVFGEIFRVLPYLSGSASKGIILPGFNRENSAALYPDVVYPASTTWLVVAPFRAVVGSRATGTDDEWLRGIRSAHFIGTGTAAPGAAMRPTATTSNNRWDLVYAKVDVDVDQATVNRYVKDVDGSVALQAISTTKKTQVSVVILAGTEGATPALPPTPADGAGSYYIPLAYILLTHPFIPGTTPITAGMVNTVAVVLAPPQFVGGSPLRPANRCHKSGVSFGAAWTIAAGRPAAHLPSSMVGKIERVFGLEFSGSEESVAAGATLVDDSIDWRGRIIKVKAYVGAIANVGLAWGKSAAPSSWPQSAEVTKEIVTFTGGKSSPPFYLSNLDDTDGLATGATLLLVVNSSGNIEIERGATNPNHSVLYWIEASGQFYNV